MHMCGGGSEIQTFPQTNPMSSTADFCISDGVLGTKFHCREEIPECGTGLKTSAGRHKFHLIFPELLGWCFTIHHVMRAALSLGQEFPKLCTSQSEAAKFPH